jgi:hypothetical protein
MNPFVYVGGLFLVIAVTARLNHRRRRPQEIHFDEVPDFVRDEVLRRVPSLTAERVVMKPDRFRLEGEADGQPIQIKVKVRGIGAGRHIYRFQIQLETRSAYRSLKGKHLIDPHRAPNIVIDQARQAAEKYGAPFEDVTRVKAATVQGRNAFDIRSWSSDWRVEVELLDDGEILEMELDYRPGEGTRH